MNLIRKAAMENLANEKNASNTIVHEDAENKAWGEQKKIKHGSY